ncbi:hypothetical protein [Ekhidna sp.]|uniref:hypothetical protein n=1 Tax=Ekhidna sp. TaxID=2608089 RepID=UPI003298D6C7
MNHLRRITLLLATFALLFSISCSKDDDTSVDLASVQFAFDQSNPPIDQGVINNLVGSDDPNAALAGTYLSSANLMTIWLAYFNQPSNAVQTDAPIGGACGTNSVTYTWTTTAGSETFTVAYQICESSDKYIFQVFWSINGGDFDQIIYAEESKGELRSGFMQLFGTNPNAEIGSTVVLEYAWEESSDGSFDYTVSDDEQGFLIEISVNADNSGTLSYTIGGSLYYSATWDATGTSGTYAYYSNGEITESGSWPS